MKRIPLTRGLFALVDDEDYEWLAQWKWYAHKGADGRFHAVRTLHEGDSAKTVRMSREILSATEGEEVDHIHHHTLDNRRSQIRIASRDQNQHNCKIRNDNSSGFRGVSWVQTRRKWRVQISVAGSVKHVGLFLSKIEAANAYDDACMARGQFANLNFPIIYG